MSYKVAVLVIHGMGRQKPSFANDMITEINDYIDDGKLNPDDICWKGIYWAPEIQEKENKLMNILENGESDVDAIRLRKFVVSVLGDAVAYQNVPNKSNNMYYRIHKIINQSIRELRVDIGEDLPVIIMAHSLGCTMINDYIWDRQRANNNDEFGQTAFERLETLSGIITFGCNIPLFTLAYAPVTSIKFPPENLPDDLKQKAEWLNFYDPDDILGYPLKGLSDSYHNTVTRDITINSGGILTSWNTTSHTQYWTDNSFTKPAAKYIGKFLG